MATCPVCSGSKTAFFSLAQDRLGIDPGVVYRICRCVACGMGWTLPRLSEDDLEAYYPGYYLGDTAKVLEDHLRGRWKGTASWRMEAEKVRLVERFRRRGRLLDVGCGEGKFLWALDRSRWDPAGIELSRETVDLVTSQLPGIKLHQGTLDSVLLDEVDFDVITFWHVLEHLPQPGAALDRAARLLRPGGLVFISLPNIESLQAHWFRSAWYPFGDVPRHIYHFSPHALELLLRRAQFVSPHLTFFSKKVNFHSWKHSMRSWCRSRIGSEAPYYLAKPVLHLLPLLEQLTGKFAIMTMIARKASGTGSPSTPV